MDEWQRGPSGALCIFHQRSWSIPVSRHQAVLPSLAIAHLPPGEGSNSLPATVHPSLEGNSAPTIQAPGSLPSPTTAHLPPGEGSSPLPRASHLCSEDVSSSQASSLHIHSEGNSSLHPSSTTRVGQGHNPPGQAGKVIGAPQAQSYTAFPGGQFYLPGGQPHPPYPLIGPTKVLQVKNPTLSGSLTHPTNP